MTINFKVSALNGSLAENILRLIREVIDEYDYKPAEKKKELKGLVAIESGTDVSDEEFNAFLKDYLKYISSFVGVFSDDNNYLGSVSTESAVKEGETLLLTANASFISGGDLADEYLPLLLKNCIPEDNAENKAIRNVLKDYAEVMSGHIKDELNSSDMEILLAVAVNRYRTDVIQKVNSCLEKNGIEFKVSDISAEIPKPEPKNYNVSYKVKDGKITIDDYATFSLLEFDTIVCVLIKKGSISDYTFTDLFHWGFSRANAAIKLMITLGIADPGHKVNTAKAKVTEEQYMEIRKKLV